MSQPQRIAQLTRRLTTNGERIANVLLARQLGDPIDIRRNESAGRTSGVPRPTEATSLDWADAQQRDARQLGRLLTGHQTLPVLGAAEIADRLDNPLPTTWPIRGIELTVDRLVEIAGAREPSTHEWRTVVSTLGLAWHVAAKQIHDGWTALYASRWRTDSRGTTVLDQTAEAAALEWVGRIEKLERQLAGLLRRLTPANIRLCAGHRPRYDGGPLEPCRVALTDDDRDGLCPDCAGRPCRCGCFRNVPRGQGATHPTCRKRMQREREQQTTRRG